MRAPRPDRFDLVTGAHYTMTPDKFMDGCFIRTDAVTGQQIGSGENTLGGWTTSPLYVPLCGGCDKPVPTDGVCHDCEYVHADLVPMADVYSDPLLGKAA